MRFLKGIQSALIRLVCVAAIMYTIIYIAAINYIILYTTPTKVLPTSYFLYQSIEDVQPVTIQDLQSVTIQDLQSVTIQDLQPVTIHKVEPIKILEVVEPVKIQCKKNQILSPGVIKQIKTFILFIGYPRSGSSIVGSILDAHPHVVISHEMCLMLRWSEHNIFNYNNIPGSAASKLYKKIYSSSVQNSKPRGIRNDDEKGYTLSVKHSCQGSFDRYIDVIGDKAAYEVCLAYRNNKNQFVSNIKKIKATIGIPMKIIHVIRNPFDNIATMYLYGAGDKKFVALVKKNKLIQKIDKDLLNLTFYDYFDTTQAVTELIPIFGRNNTLDVHHRDFIHYPEETIKKIFQFVEVPLTKNYLEMSTNKIFKETDQSRKLIEWSTDLKKMVEEKIKEIPFLQEYDYFND